MNLLRAITLFTVLTSSAHGQVTEIITIPSGGGQSNGNALYTALSRDARYVAYQCAASNLVVGDTNSAPDVFVRDRTLGITIRASVDSAGVEGNGNSHDPVLSGDGRYLGFFSYATNLVPNDTNNAPDAFVRDLVLNTTFCLSVDASGNPANGGSRYPAFSGSASVAVFHSVATNLVPVDANGVRDVFGYELATGAITLVSTDAAGVQGNGDSANGVLSQDGRYCAFESLASNLVSSDTNGVQDIFVKDRLTGSVRRVSVDGSGAEGPSAATLPSISADGRFVAFNTQSGLVPTDTNGISDVFVRDVWLSLTERASLTYANGEPLGYSYDATISPDGRWVVFPSRAINLVPGDDNSQYDIFIRDRLTNTTDVVTRGLAGADSDGQSLYPSSTPDGRYVAFDSLASNLVAGDVNMERDIFLVDRGPTAGYLYAYCFGDGASFAPACPCGNSGAPGNGCANSVNVAGANLAASGMARVSADSLVLSGSGMPPATALFFQGSLRQAGGAGVAFGDGLRCVGGTIYRLGTKSNAGGASQYPQAGDVPISVKGSVSAGDVRCYQVWSRNADPAFCTTNTFNLTNGVQVLWGS